MSSIERSTIAARVSQELRRRIVSGEYPVGMKLQQELIARELGVSRSPVREALNQLEGEGLVTIISQKGATVSSIGTDEVYELFEIRLLLEPYLIKLSIPNMLSRDFDMAQEVITEMNDVDPSKWAEANWRFHSILYGPANRPTMMKTLERIHETFERYLRFQIVATNGRLQAHADHQRILEACRDRQPDVAAALLKKHIFDAGSLLRNWGKGKQDSVSEDRHIE